MVFRLNYIFMPFLNHRTNLNRPDTVLFIAVALILIFGLVMLSSASVAVGFNRFGDGGFYIKRQLVALIVGAAAFYVCYRIDYHLWQKYAFFLFLFSIFLLVLVFMPGIGVGGYGARRWLNLYFFRSFQPAEFVKLTLILYLSTWFSGRGEAVMRDLKTGVLPFIGLLIVLFGLIIKQPDLGTLLVICWIGMVLYFVGGAHPKHFAGIILSGVGLLGLMIKFADYRMDRITTYFHPLLDPQGIGYHITQAFYAIGSGGIFGVGLGHSRQKFLYLPEVTGDSIFAVIAEELGFIFCAVLIALFLLLLWRGIRIAKGASDNFGKLAAVGITAWIVGQAFLNIGAITGALPLTGIPLPLVSYGGTALVMALAGLGILFNISKSSRV